MAPEGLVWIVLGRATFPFLGYVKQDNEIIFIVITCNRSGYISY